MRNRSDLWAVYVASIKDIATVLRREGMPVAGFDYLVRAFLILLEKFPAGMSVVSAGVAVAVTIGAVFAAISDTQREKQRLKENTDYAAQLAKLNDTSEAIEDLLAFVENQKKAAKSSQIVVEDFQKEHQKLKPLVDADKEVVDSLFSAYEEKQAAKESTNYWWGFAGGVVTSLIASLITTVLSPGWKVWKKKGSRPPAGDSAASSDVLGAQVEGQPPSHEEEEPPQSV